MIDSSDFFLVSLIHFTVHGAYLILVAIIIIETGFLLVNQKRTAVNLNNHKTEFEIESHVPESSVYLNLLKKR